MEYLQGCQRWRATLWRGGKRVTVGQYKTVEEAANARRNAEAGLGYTARHGLKNFQEIK